MTQFLSTAHVPTPSMQCQRANDVVNAHGNNDCQKAIGAAKSRSTSAGSSKCSSGDSCEVRAQVPSMSTEDMVGLPNYEYPCTFILNHVPDVSVQENPYPVYIKNTFIEAEKQQPSSFNGYCDIRQIQSCPGDVINAPPGLECEASDTTKHLRRAITTGSETFAKALNMQAEPSDSMMCGSENVAGSKSTISPAKTKNGGEVFEARTDAFYREVENGLPEYDYPISASLKEVPRFADFDDSPAFVIKNTFIDTQMFQSSLNSYYEPRQIKSCPPNGIEALDGLEEEPHESKQMPCGVVTSGLLTIATTIDAAASDIVHEKDQEAKVQPSTSAHWFGNIPPPPPEPPICALALEQLIPTCPPPALARDFHEDCSNSTLGFKQLADAPLSISMPQPLVPPAPKQAQILRLSEALSEPALGSPELPTVGSAAHYCGNCKPCAHVEMKQCKNGINCSFCHLCPPGELKRRQKAKRSSMIEQNRRAT